MLADFLSSAYVKSLELVSKTPDGWRIPRRFANYEAASNVAPAFGVRSRNCGSASPSGRKWENGIKTFAGMKDLCK